jgi:RNA polymerase sigma factor (sigma-70 family)
MTRAEFDALITRHLRGMVRFAHWLGGSQDDVQDAVVRLFHTGAYLKYEPEAEDTKRIPHWLRRAVSFDVNATRARARRRERLLKEGLDEKVHIKLLAVASEGDDTEDGFSTTAELDLVVLEPDTLQRLVAVEEGTRVSDVMNHELGALPPATALAMRLVYGEGMSWAQAGLATGVAPDALRMRVARALPGLRERLAFALEDVAHVVSIGATALHSLARTAQPGTRR